MLICETEHSEIYLALINYESTVYAAQLASYISTLLLVRYLKT